MDAVEVLARGFLVSHPAEGARVLERLAPEDGAAVLGAAPPEIAAPAVQRMATFAAAECLGRVDAGPAAAIVAALPLDVAALVLRRMEGEARGRLLEAVSGETRRTLEVLLRYPEGTAGAVMDPRLLALPPDISVGEARTRIRRAPRHVLYYLYVVDRAGVLVGVVNLRELLLPAPSQALAAVMRPSVVSVPARAERATILAHPGWRSYHALPVVDDGGIFVGAIRYETFRRLEDEASSAAPAQSLVPTLLTLGELYWMGLSGMLSGMGALLAAEPTRRPGRAPEDRHGA